MQQGILLQHIPYREITYPKQIYVYERAEFYPTMSSRLSLAALTQNKSILKFPTDSARNNFICYGNPCSKDTQGQEIVRPQSTATATSP
jgi:hypothetical protein